ncbi:MAG TPA: hypothetical protein VFC65_11865 [Prolixibacteraceae bacterium]|nr:hypothetical protein [Prolixibacteraceae bacterium]
MENNIQAKEPNKKKINDFIITFAGIAALIVALMLVKYALHAFHLI